MLPMVADVVWPALFVVHYLFASYAIILGLIIEFLAFYYFLHFSFKKSILSSITVNLISALIGTQLIIILGLGWEFTGGQLLSFMGIRGTFHPLNCSVSWLMASIINAIVEFWPLVWIFKVKRSWRLFWFLLALNFISVGFAFLASFFMDPPQF